MLIIPFKALCLSRSLERVALLQIHAFHKFILVYRASLLSCVEVVYNLRMKFGAELRLKG
jgi:hypothetical protein